MRFFQVSVKFFSPFFWIYFVIVLARLMLLLQGIFYNKKNVIKLCVFISRAGFFLLRLRTRNGPNANFITCSTKELLNARD